MGGERSEDHIGVTSFLGGCVTNMSCFAKMSLIDWELHETNRHVHGHISRATPFSPKSEWDPGNLTNVP